MRIGDFFARVAKHLPNESRTWLLTIGSSICEEDSITSTISASAERELERRAKHKLAVLRHVEEVSGSVAATCRYYGITRTAYYKWRKRYEEESFEGLKDRSSVPHRSPNATSAEVIEQILWLRQQYHFGPHKIAMYLKRYHDITNSPSRIWRILNKLERVGCRPPSVTNPKRPGGSATRSNALVTNCRST